MYRVHGTTTWTSFGSPISATTVTITGLQAGTAYDFEVQAINPFGTSTSGIAQATTLSTLTINAISLSATSFTAGAAVGTVVGTINVAMSSGNFTGSLSLSGADAGFFQLVSGQLQVGVAGTIARNYSVTITATQSGVSNSPQAQNFSISSVATSQEAAEGLVISTVGPSMNASTVAGSADPNGPWNVFSLTAANGNSINLSAAGQSPITTTSGNVLLIAYGNHTCFQKNNQNRWWFWDTTLAFGPSNWVEFGVSTVNVNTVNYSANAPVNTAVGSVSVNMISGGTFGGTLLITDPTNSFKIVGNQIQASKNLTQSSYTNVVITANPYVTTDNSHLVIGEVGSSTVTIAQTGSQIVVPVAVHLGTYLGGGTGSYGSIPAHWQGINTALGYNASTNPIPVLACVGANAFAVGNGTSDPNTPGWGSSELGLVQSVTGGSNVLPLALWPFCDAGSDTNFAAWAAGNYDSQIIAALDRWRTAGFKGLYFRPNWEFNQGPGGASGTFSVENANKANWIACYKHVGNLLHTYNNAHPGFAAKLLWNPDTTWFNNIVTFGGNVTAAVNSYFPIPDGSAVNGKYVDVIATDLYAGGYKNDYSWPLNSAIPDGQGANSIWWYLETYAAMCQAYNASFAICELNDNLRVGTTAYQTWIPQNFTNWINSLGSRAPAVKVEFLALFDVTTGDGVSVQFTNGGNPNDQAAWKTCFQPGTGTLKTTP